VEGVAVTKAKLIASLRVKNNFLISVTITITPLRRDKK